ncbi:hypothetical protein JYB88_15395 [Shewanella cyperi]|uniref:DUF4435 domain-containing protein n=1 Tax=Shewanella cyperi TaxID=2814292 RepID=A0A975AJQ9_9GAMM|nr:hypothetical protein [Shewanella cyperi]QSX29562.1 hypothetical protein JYB88_15395 [Shewanella cyperi]
MKSDFTSYFTKPDFTKAYGFDKDSNGIIYIENEKDSVFWQELLVKAGLSNYQIKYGSKNKSNDSRGKAGLKKFFESLNINALVGIDSDYDYITHAKVKEPCKCIARNKFILHTFSYSRESVIMNDVNINKSIGRIYFSECINFCFNSFLSELSNKIYADLVHLLTLHEMNTIDSGHINSSFSKLTVIYHDDGTYGVSYDDSFAKGIIDKNIIDNDRLRVHKTNYENLGLTNESAYRFIDGHKVESLIYEVVKSEQKRLIDREQKKIRDDNANNGNIIGERIKELHNHLRQNCSFFSILNSQPLDHDFVYQRILEKAKDIKNTSETQNPQSTCS